MRRQNEKVLSLQSEAEFLKLNKKTRYVSVLLFNAFLKSTFKKHLGEKPFLEYHFSNS